MLTSRTRKAWLNRFDSIPARKGTRPSTIRGPLHIQCDGIEDTKYLRRLISEVLAWPQIESTPPIVSAPDLISIHLKRSQGANSSLTTTAVKEFAKVYLEAPTIYLTLPLVTAHWAILRGWGEPHYLASQGLMAAGTLLLYAPRDESELEVCRLTSIGISFIIFVHFSQAYEFVRTSLELKQAYAEDNR